MAEVNASEVQDAPTLRFSGCIRNKNSGLQAEKGVLFETRAMAQMSVSSAGASIEMLTPKMMVSGDGLWELIRSWVLALINEISDLIKEAPKRPSSFPQGTSSGDRGEGEVKVGWLVRETGSFQTLSLSTLGS